MTHGDAIGGDDSKPAAYQVAVVIPFYQSEPGILSRALKSVFAQNVEQTSVVVLIVDDASPCDPMADIVQAGPAPSGFGVKVISRSNGGPGAARNTGLAAVPPNAEYIAFLDSDDIWDPSHLSRALAVLQRGYDLYFSDHETPQGIMHLRSTRLLAHAESGDGRLSPVPGVANVLSCDAHWLASLAAQEFLAHASTIVFSARRLGHLRFVEELRAAGEDHVFQVDLMLAASRACFSTDCGLQRGKGLNVYDSAQVWGEQSDLRRRVFNLGSSKRILTRFPWKAGVEKHLRRRIARGRRTVSFLFFRRVLRSRRVPWAIAGLLWREDMATLLLSPVFATAFVFDRMLRRNDPECSA